MIKVNDGHGTIAEGVVEEMRLIHSCPQTSVSTGFRWYSGLYQGKDCLVSHTNGTPANRAATRIFFPDEIERYFRWEWHKVPDFAPVKQWVIERR